MSKLVRYQLLLLISVFVVSSCASEQRLAERFQNKKNKISAQLRSFKASCKSGQDMAGYYTHEKTYYLNGSIDEVWNTYTQLEPTTMWSGPKNKFKKAYSMTSGNGFFRREKEVPGPSEGMVYELKLRILKLLKIPVVFEITELSADKRVIEFTYGEDNKSHGKQILRFVPVEKGVYVVHKSFFKSGNTLRDKKLYPYFHEKCLDEFHKNMAKQVSFFRLTK